MLGPHSLDQRVAWATDVTHWPADPRIRYGGTIILDRGVEKSSFITVLPPHVTPIGVKKGDPQTEILKKILAGVGGARPGGPAAPAGLPVPKVAGEVTGTVSNPRIHSFV